MAHGLGITPWQRLLAKADVGSPDECWPWLGAKFNTGRGKFYLNGRIVLAHRAAWELTHGKPPGEGNDIHHTCERKDCVNPAHLELISHGDHTYFHNIHRRA